MPKTTELELQIHACIDKHTDALASDLAELFRETTVKHVARVLREVEADAPPSRRSRQTSPKKRGPSVARAKKRRTRKVAPKAPAAPTRKKSRAEIGEEIVAFIRDNPGTGAGAIMRALGLRQSTWMSAKLAVQKAGRIRRQGTPRDSRYFATDTVVRRAAA